MEDLQRWHPAFYGQEHPIQIRSKRKSLPWFNSNLKKMVWRKSRLYRREKKSNQWSSFKSFQKHCKKAFRVRRSTTSMMSFKKDLMRTTLNISGDMSNLDVKIAMVYPLEKDGTAYQCQQRKCTNYG